MGLIKWRYIWRYVTAENIKNIIKTVGYLVCSVEPVATNALWLQSVEVESPHTPRKRVFPPYSMGG